jgi:hypothetical protein
VPLQGFPLKMTHDPSHGGRAITTRETVPTITKRKEMKSYYNDSPLDIICAKRARTHYSTRE